MHQGSTWGWKTVVSGTIKIKLVLVYFCSHCVVFVNHPGFALLDQNFSIKYLPVTNQLANTGAKTQGTVKEEILYSIIICQCATIQICRVSLPAVRQALWVFEAHYHKLSDSKTVGKTLLLWCLWLCLKKYQIFRGGFLAVLLLGMMMWESLPVWNKGILNFLLLYMAKSSKHRIV